MPSENAEGPKPIILRFAHYRDREKVSSNAYKFAGTKRRILSDIPVSMKKRGKWQQKPLKGLNIYLEVRKESADVWIKRTV